MLKYWLWLMTRRGLGRRGAALVAQHFSSPEAAYYAGPEAYAAVEGLRDPSPLLDKDLTEPAKILRACYEKGISVLTMQDAAYPERLRNIDDPPVALFCRGTLPDLNGPAIGVVGTRRASPYGMLHARRMGYVLSRCGCMVVSGLAKGIDTSAMLGALTGGAPVIGVLGCGVDVVYPAENRGVYADIAAHGCLLSEYPPGTIPRSEHFPVRNRIISGLSLGILVVEAPEKSGALITAARALDQGRDVFAVPANVDVPSCSGNLKLLREGAIMARDAWDVLQEYESLYPGTLVRRSCSSLRPQDLSGLPQTPEPAPQSAAEKKKDVDSLKPKAYIDLKDKMDGLSQDEQILVNLLRNGPKHIDAIVDGAEMSAGRVLASMTLLEVKGIVQRQSAKWFSLAEAEN